MCVKFTMCLLSISRESLLTGLGTVQTGAEEDKERDREERRVGTIKGGESTEIC